MKELNNNIRIDNYMFQKENVYYDKEIQNE